MRLLLLRVDTSRLLAASQPFQAPVSGNNPLSLTACCLGYGILPISIVGVGLTTGISLNSLYYRSRVGVPHVLRVFGNIPLLVQPKKWGQNRARIISGG